MNIKKIIIRLFVLVFMLIPSIVAANCISPLLTPRECDFKNEDTNLWLYQPPLKWTEEDKFEENIDAAKQFATNYINSIKVTGDAHIRYLHVGKAAAQQAMEAFQTAQALAAEASNDPWNLKTIYTDLICEAFWQTVEGTVPGFEAGDCAFEWIAAIQNLQKNAEAIQKIEDIINNPHLLLGEEWGDVADDMDRVMAEYNELETMARNLTDIEMEQEIRDKFRTFDQMLAAPVNPLYHNNIERPEIDLALENTVRDIMMGTQAAAKNMYGAGQINARNPNYVLDPANPANYRSDLEEIEGLEYKNEFAMGRMQGTELNNMAKSLEGQAWLEIIEQYRAIGYMTGLDMQSDLQRDKHSKAMWAKATEELQPPGQELNPTDGNPVGFNPAPAAFNY